MPVLRRYKGRVVEHIRRRDGGLLLTFANTTPGERKERQLVSQADWDAHGEAEFVQQLDVRALQRETGS